MRKDGFAHVNSGEPLTFYATERGYDLIRERVEIDDIPTSDVKEVKIKPFEQFKDPRDIGLCRLRRAMMKGQIPWYLR